MEEYKNDDGTYTSPRNGKTYKNLKAFTSHWFYAGTTDPQAFAKRLYKVECNYCKKSVGVSNIKKHEETCYLNPTNIKLCEVCGKPIKNYKDSKGTCSYSCSNKHFRHLRNKPEKYIKYTTICWQHHKKECVVCGENKIVAVHHFNEDHNDNTISNLVPLCPTHHQYMHSKYKDEILNIVEKYIDNFKKQC
jgi:hypothetical protein